MRVVVPDKIVRPRDNRSGRWPHLAAKPERVRLEGSKVSTRANDLVFIDGSFPKARREKLPEPAIDPLAHGVAAPVPLIEIANHGDALRLRRPHSEENSVFAFMSDRMRAKAFVKPLVGSLNQEIIVERTQDRTEGVGVEKLPHVAVVLGAETVSEAVLLAGQKGLEKIALASPFEVDNRAAKLNESLQMRDAGNE